MKPSNQQRHTRSADDRLAERAQELEALRQAEHDRAFGGDQRDLSGEVSLVGQHPADVADFTYERELTKTTEDLLEREAAQVAAAREARDRGTYGICARCGQEIAAARLAARPEATLCLVCQQAAESGRVN